MLSFGFINYTQDKSCTFSITEKIIFLPYMNLKIHSFQNIFYSPTQIKEKSIVGGVTLNHLSWASLLGG